MTSDKHNWLLQGFMHQWDKYASDHTITANPVLLAGFTKPDFPINEKRYEFYSIGAMSDYPANKWSDALLKVMKYTNDPLLLVMLEDYWLVRQVSYQALIAGQVWMTEHPHALRFDLTTDRLNCGKINMITHRGDVDIFRSYHTPYQVSLQASIWNVESFKRILTPGMSPWEIELQGTNRLASMPELGVYGQAQWALCYQIMVRGGQFVKEGDWMHPARQLSEDDYEELRRAGCLGNNS